MLRWGMYCYFDRLDFFCSKELQSKPLDFGGFLMSQVACCGQPDS